MKEILIFSNGEKIGDGIIKLPFIHEVFTQLQDYRIIWLAYGTTVYSGILKEISSQYIGDVFFNSKLNFLPWNKISHKYDFKNQFYDIIIDTQKTVWKTLALKRLKSNIFISSSASWMFSDLKPKKEISKERKYYVEDLFDMLNLITKKNYTHNYIFNFPFKLEQKLKLLFKIKEPCIGIAPGAGEDNKKWNILNFIKVANFFREKNYHIAFFLGPDDDYEKKIILDHIPDAFFPEDLIKSFSGPEIVMTSTKFLICSLSNDSGVSHMLSTNYCPLVKLFGPKDSEKFTPNKPQIKTISSKYYGSNNINDIPVQGVIDLIQKLIL